MQRKYVCMYHKDRPAWVVIKRGDIEGSVCYECYMGILKEDKKLTKDKKIYGID